MRQSETLSEDLRRSAYVFVLSIYETFERLPIQSELIRDIESHANRFLSLTAVYPVSIDKRQLVRDISAELKSLRALLGVSRDISLLERGPAHELLEKCGAVDLAFEELLEPEASLEAPLLEAVPQERLPKMQEPLRSRVPAEVKAPAVASVAPIETGDTGVKKEKPGEISLRQKAILEVLKRRDKTTVGELGVLFSGRVSKKTLQRDLQDLVEQKIVHREGDRRWTSYFLA